MKLPATLTMDNAEVALAALQAEPGSGPWAIDASALSEFDSAALALLLQAKRRAQAEGRGLQVLGAPPKLAELAQLYGVDALLGLQGAGYGAAA